MMAVIVAILSLTLAGVPVTLAIDRRARGPLLLGISFLYGSALVFFVMLALSIVHVPWTLVTVAVGMLLSCLVAWLLRVFLPQQPSKPATQQPSNPRPHWLDIASAVTIAGYALFATVAPPWEWDFWVIWGLKGRVFFEHRGIDWRFLESHWNVFVHPDYPLLVSLDFDFVALLNGAWNDRWLGALFVAWAVALLLIVRDLAAREATVLPAAMVTFAVATFAVSRFVGLAEGPLIAFGAAGVLFLRRALQSDDSAAWRHGALLLGCAANVKNEGLALLVAVLIALVLVRARDTLRLWPAIVLAAPWLILRATHSLPTDILAPDVATGSILSRIVNRLPRTVEIFTLLARLLYEPWFWVALLAGVLVVPAVVRREPFVLLVTAIQLVFYVGSYYATPHNVRWHIATSWWRLADQIALPITFVVVLTLAQYVAGVDKKSYADSRGRLSSTQ